MATPIPINRCRFNPAEIMRATGAAFSGPPDLSLTGVSIDTRSIAPGALFIALRGVRDGHEFVREAAARGAAAAIVERGRTDPALPCFEVDDTLAALGALARFHLERMRALRPVPTIAIGGAAGKTTTKEMTAALARALFGDILATPGNLNNLIGVPMTILTLTDAHRAAVLECGTNRRGEIARLAQIVTPDVALVLNVDIEHTEGLGSLEGIADEEAELFKTARIAIVGTAESMLLARVPAQMRTPTRTLTFGATADAGVRLASRVVVAPGRQRIALALTPALTADGVDAALEANLGMLGAASAMNAAAAVAAVSAASPRPLGRADLAAIARALAAVEPVPGRLSTRELVGVVVIDDTYNANPRSVRVALEAARETADGLRARLVVALGDMLELGALAPAMHAEAVRDLFQARPDACVLVGPEMAAAARAVDSGATEIGSGAPARPPVIQFAADSTAAAAAVRALVRPGDVLLVKGSRGIAMERIIDALAAQ
ncbi:MAG: UDP-N-acetylmuramoyl-tripeptide--D-alanyl-D-alanine ligase [Candidatus Binataceae bacterium]|jgi:UDP-N-acetylmuramoyl-tripeptide--D-alanyl-D-alanine ligase